MNILKQASLQVVTLAANGLDGFNKEWLDEIKNLKDLSESERSNKLKELAPQLRPLILKVMSNMGIKGPDDLAVPSIAKKFLWEKLTTSILPELLIGYVYEGAVFLPRTSQRPISKVCKTWIILIQRLTT